MREPESDVLRDFAATREETAAQTEELSETEEVSDESSQIEQLIQERDKYLEQLQRSVAEFANYRKRVEQDRQRARAFANKDLLTQVVPLADDFERALATVPVSEADAPWVEGVSLIEQKLMSVLEREGVTRIDALGQPFDPAQHEAVAVTPGGDGSTVVEVFQNGYSHGDVLLRPAMVRVGSPIEDEQSDADREPGIK